MIFESGFSFGKMFYANTILEFLFYKSEFFLEHVDANFVW